MARRKKRPNWGAIRKASNRRAFGEGFRVGDTYKGRKLTAADAANAGASGPVAEGMAGFAFGFTIDTSQADAAIAQTEERLDDLGSGTGVAGPLGRRLSFGERLENRVRAMNSRLGRRFGLTDTQTVTGGARASFLEFGAEGVRVGDLRLSRSGVSLSEKTFVGSRVLGFAAVAGQVAGHVIRTAANYDEVVRAHEGLPARRGPNDETPSASFQAHARTIGEFTVGAGLKVLDQAASVFGGDQLAGVFLHIIDPQARNRTLADSIRQAQANKASVLEALDFPTMLDKYRKEAIRFQQAKIKEDQKVRELFDGVHNDIAQKYGTRDADLKFILQESGKIAQFKASRVRDVRGNRILENPYASETEGR